MTENKKSNAGKHLTGLIGKGYMDLHQRAVDGAFCVWIAINVPAEVFAGFENVVYAVPESHAALCAGKGVGVSMCEKAEAQGYSMDLCSYARIDIGNASDNGKESPTFGLPRPDLLISNNNTCSLITKWFDVHHRTWDVPHFIMDIPFCYEPQKPKDHAYIVGQIKALIRFIEKLSGQSFNMDRYTEAVHHTWSGIREWKRFLASGKHVPSPITAFDSFVHMAPFLTLRGTPHLKTHFTLLADEAEENLSSSRFPVEKERYRLFWDNIAPWHQLRKMSRRLADLGANIVGASYTSCMGTVEGSFELYEWDEKDPFDYIARTMNSYMCPHGMVLRHKAMARAVKALSIDGVIFASNRSCKPYSITQMDQQRKIRDEVGVPAVLIEVDHADSRKYSEESAFVRIEALLEQIDAARSRGLV
ncbi:MAG: 2-hydroxyacyl-CoA dehydratase family protein [Desulfobacterales bacterium]|nr:2-hydroxyacyl-CoA dehydratase family protein [Desulfobacterales bacterium]